MVRRNSTIEEDNSRAEIELGGTADRVAETAYDMLLLLDDSDMLLLLEDSETCIDDLEKARGRGIELMGSSKSCGPICCYCGIRLHPLSCPKALACRRMGSWWR